MNSTDDFKEYLEWMRPVLLRLKLKVHPPVITGLLWSAFKAGKAATWSQLPEFLNKDLKGDEKSGE